MNPIRRVCLYGGAGVGKSTVAARLFSDLKVAGCKVEYVAEYVKTWACMGRVPQSYDQFYVFAKQLHAEDRLLRHVDCIVTDSPLLLNVVYSHYYKCPFADDVLRVALKFEKEFPATHIVLHRAVPFQDDGRLQSLDESRKVDDFVPWFLNEHDIPTMGSNATRYPEILADVKASLELA